MSSSICFCSGRACFWERLSPWGLCTALGAKLLCVCTSEGDSPSRAYQRPCGNREWSKGEIQRGGGRSWARLTPWEHQAVPPNGDAHYWREPGQYFIASPTFGSADSAPCDVRGRQHMPNVSLVVGTWVPYKASATPRMGSKASAAISRWNGKPPAPSLWACYVRERLQFDGDLEGEGVGLPQPSGLLSPIPYGVN